MHVQASMTKPRTLPFPLSHQVEKRTALGTTKGMYCLRVPHACPPKLTASCMGATMHHAPMYIILMHILLCTTNQPCTHVHNTHAHFTMYYDCICIVRTYYLIKRTKRWKVLVSVGWGNELILKYQMHQVPPPPRPGHRGSVIINTSIIMHMHAYVFRGAIIIIIHLSYLSLLIQRWFQPAPLNQPL